MEQYRLGRRDKLISMEEYEKSLRDRGIETMATLAQNARYGPASSKNKNKSIIIGSADSPGSRQKF
jgi:hypothetical protein